MAERQLASSPGDQPRVDRLARAARDVGDGATGHGGDLVEPELAAEEARQTQELDVIGSESRGRDEQQRGPHVFVHMGRPGTRDDARPGDPRAIGEGEAGPACDRICVLRP